MAFNSPTFVDDAPSGPYLNAAYFNSVGSAITSLENAPYMALSPSAFTDWTRRADQSVLTDNSRADDGTVFNIARADASVMRVNNRRLEITWSGNDGGATYINETLSGTVKRIGMTVGFGPGGATNNISSLAMVTWNTPYPDNTSDAQIHFSLSPAGWNLSFVADGVVGTPIASKVYSTPLVQDWRQYTAEIAIHGTVATIVDPMGEVVTLNNTKFASITGNTACWEFFSFTGGVAFQEAIYAMWADTAPSPSGFGALTDAGRINAKAVASALGATYPPASSG